jgi:hypothetical protein
MHFALLNRDKKRILADAPHLRPPRFGRPPLGPKRCCTRFGPFSWATTNRVGNHNSIHVTLFSLQGQEEDSRYDAPHLRAPCSGRLPLG